MSTIYKHKDGHWCSAYIHGVNADGKPKSKYLYGKTKKEVEEKEIEILTIDEQTAYISAAQKEKQGLLYLLTLFTGLRLGEVIGLRWSNIDLNESMLYIRESLKRSKVYNADGSYTIKDVIKDPKTSNSKRSIPLPQFILLELKKHKIKSINQENDLVFSSEAGTPLRSENVRRTHYRICDNANIRRISFHALRHTFATRMIEKNTDIKTVQKWLSHSKIELTYNIYVHVQENTIKESVKILDNLYEEMMSNLIYIALTH